MKMHLACAHLLRNLAEITPDKRALYLEKAALWDTIAANTERNFGTRDEMKKNEIPRYRIIPG